ncbi:hypothetical protein LIER_26490 [Lithospermum erythrorhizon]|uniref:Uncharacterized protein n=1 Tax=Lithospermum erythrorhizon TaxID=34254 RepID=A0AAV3R8S3_LITER
MLLTGSNIQGIEQLKSVLHAYLLSGPDYYRNMLGKLNFLTNTRPDLAFTVQTLSQFMQKPRQSHLEALHHLIHYVKNTVVHEIILQGSSQLPLKEYSDLN